MKTIAEGSQGPRLRAARPGRQPGPAQRAARGRPGRAVLVPGRARAAAAPRRPATSATWPPSSRRPARSASGSAPTRSRSRRSSPTSNGFDYPLLSDESGDVARSLGVKRKYITPVKRATFVIDRDRTIRKVITSEMNMDVHADQALAALKAPVADWSRAVPQRDLTRLRPHLQRRLHGAASLGRGVALRRRPVHQRRHRYDDPARRGEHDRGRRPPDGRDGRPPRRHHRHPAGHPARRRARRRVLGEAAAPGVRHPDHPRAAPDRRRRDGAAAQARRTARRSSSRTAGRSGWSPRTTASRSTGSPRCTR